MNVKLQCKTEMERKEMAQLISEVTGESVVYERMPTCAYKIGDFHIDLEGVITTEFDEIFMITFEEIGKHILENVKFVINESPQVNNRVRNLIESKKVLIEKSISSKISITTCEEYIEIEVEKLESDKIIAFGVFIQKSQQLGSTLKYVASKQKEVVNEKYAFRCFLLRLGFIGKEYKEHRNLLLKSLTGNSAFKEVQIAISK